MNGKARLARIAVLGVVLCGFCCTVQPAFAAEEVTETRSRAYGPVAASDLFRRHGTDANAERSGLWSLRPATPATFLDSLSMERSRKEIYSQMYDVLFAPGDPFEGIGIDKAEVADILEERAFIEALSPKKQYKIMYGRGERNLLILKLKRNKGYYNTQAS